MGFKLLMLNKKLEAIEQAHNSFKRSRKYKELNSEDKHNEDNVFYSAEYLPIWEEIQEIQTRRFLSKLRMYKIPYPTQSDEDGKIFWDYGQYGGCYLTVEGYHKLRPILREEQKARRDMIVGWAIPVITAITGLLGSMTAILTVIKYWNK